MAFECETTRIPVTGLRHPVLSVFNVTLKHLTGARLLAALSCDLRTGVSTTSTIVYFGPTLKTIPLYLTSSGEGSHLGIQLAA